MASGFTDWMLSLNIDGQKDGYFSVFPTYGNAQVITYNLNCVPNDYAGIAIVAGKGIIYGGYVSVNPAQSQKADHILVKIDGISFVGVTFESFAQRGFTQGFCDTHFLALYDDVNFIYTLIFNRGITFDSSFSVEYYESQGNTFTVNGRLLYALIP